MSDNREVAEVIGVQIGISSNYLKEVWIQATSQSEWQYIMQLCANSEVSWWRDGIRAEPFDFDKEHRDAYRASDFRLSQED